ncbi:putative quinol monooxygenase [Litoreibacter roseus]|uniref:ABM domain-containing protein n=1 Tax=Litoreibacter roseus TaxID=2601869 RepID=A0A6N6JDK0_9RHOB|nr:putative quinol monooxygenase [Litoreibacter roseus]GFE63272.1 hypothetical protein KIN_03460 [Litoreibacter roseus]
MKDIVAKTEPITIVVQFQTKPGQQDHAKEVVNRILRDVLAEEGNVNVQMFQDPDDPTKFLFIETFVSKAAETAHTQTPHMQRFYQEIAEPLDGESTLAYWRPYGLFEGAGARTVDFDLPN